MTFETWLEARHSISHMIFTLRHPANQAAIIEEWNRLNRGVKHDKV